MTSGLKHLKFALGQTTIPTSGGDFTVRGLGFSDLAFLYSLYADQMKAVYAKFTGDKQSKEEVLAALVQDDMIGTVIKEAPTLVAAMILIAASPVGEKLEESDINIALSIPMADQVAALEAIGRHTFEEHGGVKKLMEAVIRIMQATSGAVAELRR